MQSCCVHCSFQHSADRKEKGKATPLQPHCMLSCYFHFQIVLLHSWPKLFNFPVPSDTAVPQCKDLYFWHSALPYNCTTAIWLRHICNFKKIHGVPRTNWYQLTHTCALYVLVLTVIHNIITFSTSCNFSSILGVLSLLQFWLWFTSAVPSGMAALWTNTQCGSSLRTEKEAPQKRSESAHKPWYRSLSNAILCNTLLCSLIQ